MRRYDPRLLLGVLLVLGGLLSLLDAMGIISNGGGIFWGLIFAAGGLIFLYMLISTRENWWAAFPAFTLLGLAASSFLPDALTTYISRKKLHSPAYKIPASIKTALRQGSTLIVTGSSMK